MTIGVGTPEQKNRERAIAARVTAAWGWELNPLEQWCRVDYYAHAGGKLTAMVEIKTATATYLDHPTFIINADKYLTVRNVAYGWHVLPLLVVEWADRTGWVNLDRVPVPPARHGGRHDEPAQLKCFIPREDFRPLTYRP